MREGSGVWFVEDRNEMDGADGSTHANQQSHVKFETPKIPVIFVLGKYIIKIKVYIGLLYHKLETFFSFFA